MTEAARFTEGAVPTHWPADLDRDYELLGELGRGGMAIVFRARDRELGREVAIKVVRPRFAADEEAVARLAREARTVAQLEHPNIVGVYSIRHLSDRSVALVMQIVPGRTLKAALQQDGPFAPERAEQVMRDVARALAYAHRAGVVHRDVKPENIFLDDISGRALLSDFGVARVMDAPTELTATGTTIGTPTYMAPEQIDGVQIDGRSDLYSLGMVGWEMLTGERPWAGESLYSVIYRQKHDPLPPVETYRDDVPPRLQYLIEGLMHKNADRRWASASRFLTLLASQQAPPGIREWQSAQRRRRRSTAYQETRRRGGSIIEAAFETVRFKRGETPLGLPSVPPEDADAPQPELPLPAEETATDAIPARRIFAIPQRRTGWAFWVAAGTLGVVGSLFAWQAMQQPQAAVVTSSGPAVLGDQPGVELPIITPPTPADSQRLLDSISAAAVNAERVVDTSSATAAGKLPAVEAEKQRATPPTVAGGAVITPPNAGGSARSSAPDSTARVPAVVSPSPVTVVPIPVTLPPSISFPAEAGIIAAGSSHSCMLRDGRALCWGSNDRGQLGDGALDARLNPQAVAGEFVFTQIAAGGRHTCGLSAAGEVFCWGNNGNGQLGDGTSAARSAPVRVNSSTAFKLIRAGSAHTCALSRSGTVQCWGSNEYGQLGDGTRQSRTSPVTITLPGPAAALAAGWHHTCAILNDGSAHCWGRNDSGQLGDGSSLHGLRPVAVRLESPVMSIAAGSGHTCAVSSAGVGFCWGLNRYGQLGNGEQGDTRNVPQAVAAGASLSVVVAGQMHTCSRTRDGRALCWGRNSNGQLGDGTHDDRSSPVQVRGGAGFAALQAGGGHTCGITSSGDAYCWGTNIDGQLGGGNRENAATPTRVSPVSR